MQAALEPSGEENDLRSEELEAATGKLLAGFDEPGSIRAHGAALGKHHGGGGLIAEKSSGGDRVAQRPG